MSVWLDEQIKKARSLDDSMMTRVNEITEATEQVLTKHPAQQGVAVSPLLVMVPAEAADLLVKYAALRVFATSPNADPEVRVMAQFTLDIVNALFKGNPVEDVIRSRGEQT